MESVYIQLIISVAAILGTVVTVIMNVYQNKKNKLIDVKIEEYKKNEAQKAKVYSDQVGQILGELWNLLYKHHFDRVYIVRPHPERKYEYLSVQLEVRRNGISSTKDVFSNQPMDEVPHMSGRLAKEDYFVVNNTMDAEIVKDVVMRSIFAQNGTKSAVVNRLEDKDNRWVASLFCTCMHRTDLTSKEIEESIKEASSKIQLILPEYNNYYEGE